jgi:hypothetical protein
MPFKLEPRQFTILFSLPQFFCGRLQKLFVHEAFFPRSNGSHLLLHLIFAFPKQLLLQQCVRPSPIKLVSRQEFLLVLIKANPTYPFPIASFIQLVFPHSI